MTAYTFEIGPIYITKGGGQVALIELLRIQLLMAGVRIQPGTYSVTVTKTHTPTKEKP